MTAWLRRAGATKGPFDMQHQSDDSIRILLWIDDPADLHRRMYGHMLLPADPRSWQPQLALETAEPGPLLQAELETGPKELKKVSDSSLRPLSYRVVLPQGVGYCFKLIESSFPKHKVPFCLPPAADDGVCDTLAPPDRHTAAAPALWMAIGPVRHPASTRDWPNQHDHVAIRLSKYVPYHLAMGASGLLLYTDAVSRHYLSRHPGTAPLIEAGNLRLVHWDMHERSHDETDGRGRVLGYNYDQALFASHALLGLSACGTNAMLLVTDLDEYLYAPQPGVKWPQPLACLTGAAPAPAAVAGGAAAANSDRAAATADGGGGATSSVGAKAAAAGGAAPSSAGEAAKGGGGAGGSGGSGAGGSGGNGASSGTAKAATGSDSGGGGVAARASPESDNQAFIGMHRIQRYNVLTSKIDSTYEAGLWTASEPSAVLNSQRHRRRLRAAPNTASTGNIAAASSNGINANASADTSELGLDYPLSLYDLIDYKPLDSMHCKVLAVPAAHVVAFFVHEGVPLHGRTQVADPGCLTLLHVPNYFRGRKKTADAVKKGRVTAFQHWLFANGSSEGVPAFPVPGTGDAVMNVQSRRVGNRRSAHRRLRSVLR